MDTGDGTIHDTCTGLQWEKKNSSDGVPDAFNLHDVDNTYAWVGRCWRIAEPCQPSEAAAAACQVQDGGLGCTVCGQGDWCYFEGHAVLTTIWDWIARVNAEEFAGHSDWRVASEAGRNLCPICDPRELERILLRPYYCDTSPCIDPIFGPTRDGGYWSSTFFASQPELYAFQVEFLSGMVFTESKFADRYVRAVRGGP